MLPWQLESRRAPSGRKDSVNPDDGGVQYRILPIQTVAATKKMNTEISVQSVSK